MDKNFKITSKDKTNISMRCAILVMLICIASYLLKVFGSDLFNKFITNDKIEKIATFIDNTTILNILAYGILAYIITQVAFFVACGNLKLKWYDYVIIIVFSFGMSALRYFSNGAITYLYDVLQYILIPLLYSLILRRNIFTEALMGVLLIYFVTNGVMLINMTLCDLKEIMYASNLIAYVLCFIEVYAIIIAMAIYLNNRRKWYVKSNIGFKQN